jgi:hypothetical protein
VREGPNDRDTGWLVSVDATHHQHAQTMLVSSADYDDWPTLLGATK